MIRSYKVKNGGVEFHLKFKHNITLISGKSGVGKTLLFEAIKQETMLGDNRFLTINADEFINGTIDFLLENNRDKVIVIDNADAILSYKHKFNIARDNKRQYIIFAHSVNGFYAVDSMIATLHVENGKGWLSYDVM